MSLIVDALKRAQEGARGRSPAFSGPLMRRPLAALGSDDGGSGKRIAILVGVGVVVFAMIGGAAWRFIRPAPRTPPRLLVVEPVVPTPPTAAAKGDGTAGTSIEEIRKALLAAQPLEKPAEAPATVASNANAAQGPPTPSGRGVRLPPSRAADGQGATVDRRSLGGGGQADLKAADTPATAGRRDSVADLQQNRPAAGGRRAPAPRPPAASATPSASAAVVPATVTPVRPAVPSTVGRRAGAAAPPPPEAAVSVHADASAVASEALAAGLRNQQAGQTARAIEDYRRGIEMDPRNPGLYNNLGVALRESSHLDEAVEAFNAALKIDPKYEKALNNLGVSRYQQGLYAEAVDLFSQALRINPANVESYNNLGMIYLLAQRWDEAITAFQQALRYDPRSAVAHYNLGQLWERHGDPDKALQDYKKFIELAGPEHAPLAKQVGEHVKQMERTK